MINFLGKGNEDDRLAMHQDLGKGTLGCQYMASFYSYQVLAGVQAAFRLLRGGKYG